MILNKMPTIKDEEYNAARDFLSRTDESGINELGLFIVQAYQRVDEMLELKDFTTCKRLIMVGCGPFPMTVIHVLKRYPSIIIEAIDIDKEALVMAKKVVKKFSLQHKVQLVHSSGVDYNYAGADIIYIANLVSPKAKVLKRVAKSSQLKTLVILRDPVQVNQKYPENGITSIDNDFVIEGESKANERFNSKDFFLRRI
jgi:hypothetical protein